MTIRSKLTLLYSGLLAIIIVAFGISLFAVTRWVLVNSVNTTLYQTTNQIVDNIDVFEPPRFGTPAGIFVVLPSLDFFRASAVAAQVWQLAETGPLLRSTSSNVNDFSDPFDYTALMNAEDAYENNGDRLPSVYSTVRIYDGEWSVMTVPYRDFGGGLVVIQVAASLEGVNQASRALLVMIAAATSLGLVGSMALGLWLTGRVLKPIDDITRAAARITSSADLKTRLEWKGPPDELGRLVSVLNGAMARLEQLFNVQQRFVADVSHELRTPLTAINGNIELIRRYGMDEASLEAIESEAKRMMRMVNDLLLLARADNGELKLNFEETDLDIVVGEAYREARILAKDRDLKVTVVDFEPVRIKGDGDRLKQLLSNLLSNAIKFTPDGGQILINLRKTEHDAIIQVQDTGIGMTEDDARRIFDRFYQADASRVKLINGEGAGLGLSIAQWIAKAHGGGIAVESQIGMGTTFTVTIPHIEEPERVMSAAVTRPRLSIIRRNPAERSTPERTSAVTDKDDDKPVVPKDKDKEKLKP
jgi:signal transduction histidine kinase